MTAPTILFGMTMIAAVLLIADHNSAGGVVFVVGILAYLAELGRSK